MSRKRSNVARLNDYGVIRRHDGYVSITEPDHLWLEDVNTVTAADYLAACEAARSERARPRQPKPAKAKAEAAPVLWSDNEAA